MGMNWYVIVFQLFSSVSSGRGLGQIPIFRKYLNVARVASPCSPYFLGFLKFFPMPPRCSPPSRFYGGNKEKENMFS